VTHLPAITNPNAARDDDDHIIVVPPEDRTIVVPPEDRTIVVPPRTPDDCVIALPNGDRLWVSLPPAVQALLPYGLRVVPHGLRVVPHELRVEGARKPRKPTLSSVAKQARKAAIAVARYEVKPDGSIVIVTTEGETTEANNPWDIAAAGLRKNKGLQ
jgi:hypothetical protein